MRFNWGKQGKDLAQFQQFILIVITEKKNQIGRDTKGDIITVVYEAEYVKFYCISLI